MDETGSNLDAGERERGKRGFGCVRVVLSRNWTRFYPTNHNFFENLCTGVANIFPRGAGVNCEAENSSFYDCMDLCLRERQKKLEARSYVTLAH